MRNLLSDLIEQAKNCNCSVCGLRKAGEASDSKSVGNALFRHSDHMDEIRRNLIDISHAMTPGNEDEIDRLAFNLQGLDYPKSAEVVKRYVALTKEANALTKLILQEMDEKNHEQSEEKAN